MTAIKSFAERHPKIAAWIGLAGRRAARTSLSRYLAYWREVVPRADGQALRALGLAPGPAYRRILWALRAAWLDGEIDSPEKEAALLERLVAEANLDG